MHVVHDWERKTKQFDNDAADDACDCCRRQTEGGKYEEQEQKRSKSFFSSEAIFLSFQVVPSSDSRSVAGQ
jgi:hypothetical protein